MKTQKYMIELKNRSSKKQISKFRQKHSVSGENAPKLVEVTFGGLPKVQILI